MSDIKEAPWIKTKLEIEIIEIDPTVRIVPIDYDDEGNRIGRMSDEDYQLPVNPSRLFLQFFKLLYFLND